MKKLFFFAAMFFSVLAFKADAQLNISVNIGTQPTWGPTGYDHVDYYYLPDIDCYYYVPGQQFVYLSGSRWIFSSSLPPQYSNYDLYSGYKVVVNSPKPYLQDNTYRTRYASYKGKRGQSVIRDSHDAKYKRPANNNHGGNNHAVRPQPKPAAGHAANNHRPAAKPQPKQKVQQKSHTVTKHTAAKSTQKTARPADHKDDKDHH